MGIYSYLDPLHVVGAVRRIVAECLDTSEVLEASALSIQKGLVNTVVVRV